MKLSLRICLAALLLAAFPASAADMPHSPRLAAGSAVRLIGGVQLSPGNNGEFQLFAVDAESGRTGSLGKYNGQLAGIAMEASGMPIVLTRDGALNRLGDAAAALALPDSRWNMRALAYWRGLPLALHVEDGGFHAAVPEGNQNWRAQPLPIDAAGDVAKAELIPLGDELHLLWNTRNDSLDDGVIRHAALQGGVWNELAPLAVGGSAGFACYVRDDSLELTAIIPDPLRSRPASVAARRWDGERWRDATLAPPLAARLGASSGVAVAVRENQPFWLATGFSGAFQWRGDDADNAELLARGLPSRFDWSNLTGLVSFAAMAMLFVFYCRRSRALSRNFPSRPPDMVSRGAALGVDWLLVSLAMSVYHAASGDIFILADLVSLGDMQDIFWINLLGLALFMAVSEAAYGCTPGKYLAGLRVRSILGGKPSAVQAVIRNLFRAIDMYPVGIAFPGLVGALATLLGPRRQRVGDIFAATMVRRHSPLAQRSFLLASASPRRLELMRALVDDVRVQGMDVDEDARPGESPEDTVLRLSKAKAEAATQTAKAMEVVVAADTVVAIDGMILGKPVDAADAANMLERLSGRSHSVFTGVTVWDAATGQDMSSVEETEVEFRVLTPEEIADYIATGDPLDKAGAYGVQTGNLVRQVRGSLSNVAGLPMEKLQGMLAALDS